MVGRIAGGEYGYSVGSFIAHAFVDPDIGLDTRVEALRTGVRHAATVVRGPLFDPTSERLKA